MNQRRKRQRVKAMTAAKARARTTLQAKLTKEDVNPELAPIEWEVLPVDATRAPRQSILRDSYVYLILILPILVLARNTSYIFTGAGYIDPWVYYGYMKHLGALKHLFPGTYYGSRLSWLLPGAMIHAALPPIPATYVLHLAVFFTAVFSLYWLLKEAFDRRIAILSAICMALYPYFWAAIGWDYVDGAGIAYYLLTMALVFAAAKPKSAHNRWLLVCGGMAYAGMVYSNLAWFIFSPMFLTLYLWFSPALAIRTLVGRTVRFLLWFGLGWLIITVVLGAVNRFLEGTFWFYAPSVLYALSTVGTKNPWKAANFGWIKTGYWLILPALACLAGMLVCITTFWRASWRDMRVFFALNLLYGAFLLVYMEGSGRPMLQLVYYASYLIPCSALAFGAILFEGATSFRKSHFRWIIAGALLGLLCVWVFITFPVLLALVLQHPTALLFAGVGITAVGLFLRGRPAGTIVGLAGLTLFCASSRAVNLPPGNDGSDIFRRISSGMEMTESARGDQPIRFWFDQKDPYSAEFHSLNSCYLWGYTAINYHFPSLENSSVDNGAFIVVPSSKPEVAPEVAGAFAERGSSARFLGKERDESGGHGYWLNFFRIEPDRAHMAPLRISFDPAGLGHLDTSPETNDAVPLSADQWKPSSKSSQGSMQTTSAGVIVEASQDPASSNTTYAEIVVGQSAVYRFVLKYRLLRGDVVFGAVTRDGTSRVDQGNHLYRMGPDAIQEFIATLDPNQPIRLFTSSRHARSRYVIGELRAYRFENPSQPQ
jgi:4-amino-4-deoxy-L-arabinose transferase-like glycosyltransferase